MLWDARLELPLNIFFNSFDRYVPYNLVLNLPVYGIFSAFFLFNVKLIFSSKKKKLWGVSYTLELEKYISSTEYIFGANLMI